MRLTRSLYLATLITVLLAALVLPASAQTTRVSIDTTRARKPISKYIYGQFMEHYGRSIYGGTWSEMLEDRKFFYPVTGESPAWTMFQPGPGTHEGEGHPYELLTRSPWMIIGEKGAVTMMAGNSTRAWPEESRSPAMNSYVGVHTPRIQLPGGGRPGGLLQERLALVSGKEYSGRIVLAGNPSAAPVEVSLVWGGGASDRDTVTVEKLTTGYAKVPLRFTALGATDNGRLEIIGKGTGSFLVGAISLMPADNIHGWRADTVALLKELNAPVYRWPGGSYVSAYNWKEGIGDPDRRPPRQNPAWKGIEHNDVGIHEFLALCREIDAEPFILVNTGFADARLAAEEVEYANGAPDTPMGRLRARNGHPAPFRVKWWGVGNEIFGQPIAEYVKKHNRVEKAMRAVDPSLQAVAVGESDGWSQQMMTSCADHMDLIGEHKYWRSKRDVTDHVGQVPESIKRFADKHRRFRNTLNSLQGKDIRIVMAEWNYKYGRNEYGEGGYRFSLQDGLGIAAGLHEYFRNSDLYFMANYSQVVNVHGAIKTTATQAEFETTGLVLKLYRHHFGTTPVEVSGSYEPLDIAAAWTEDKTAITVGLVNPTREARTISVDVKGSNLSGPGRKWTITGPARWAHNAPGKPRQVDIEQTSFISSLNTLEIAPLSVTLYSLPIEP